MSAVSTDVELSGLRRVLMRAPVRLYRWHLGRLLGERFLLLTHISRLNGQRRHALLEVAAHDPRSDTYTVACGRGTSTPWYLDVQQDPAVTIRVGGRRAAAVAQPLTPEQSGRAMRAYARSHPQAALQMLRASGRRTDAGHADCYQAGRDHIPFVQITPLLPRRW
ncbi:nitroreductase family deazaflavin-dependent oxidoreductase [Streptomyces sp. RB6PN25]|uniref:Nitroreductase family deazaflavin-dependent oxidoreductase n=1 Tax=Streptomyces humicola TaxID=2953240 RepID=A0ABT1PTD5_9ACTN|nr:nitroreductase family deazaflavin-dependent oxidoreductase [Streptomyces humicola]MCQ4080939.1 nitroreductase family deazaflavin-dependent oxidoreductase [Streptomyces humicola]